MKAMAMMANTQFVTSARSSSQRWDSHTLSAVQAIARARARANLAGIGKYRRRRDLDDASPGAGMTGPPPVTVVRSETETRSVMAKP